MKQAMTASAIMGAITAVIISVPTVKYTAATPPVVHAQEMQSNCSLASLKGFYSVQGQGTVVAQLPGLPAPPFPFGEAAIDSFDGAGTWSGHATTNFGGVVLPVAVNGSYTINEDCTGTRVINTSLGLVATRPLW